MRSSSRMTWALSQRMPVWLCISRIQRSISRDSLGRSGQWSGLLRLPSGQVWELCCRWPYQCNERPPSKPRCHRVVGAAAGGQCVAHHRAERARAGRAVPLRGTAPRPGPAPLGQRHALTHCCAPRGKPRKTGREHRHPHPLSVGRFFSPGSAIESWRAAAEAILRAWRTSSSTAGDAGRPTSSRAGPKDSGPPPTTKCPASGTAGHAAPATAPPTTDTSDHRPRTCPPRVHCAKCAPARCASKGAVGALRGLRTRPRTGVTSQDGRLKRTDGCRLRIGRLRRGRRSRRSSVGRRRVVGCRRGARGRTQ